MQVIIEVLACCEDNDYIYVEALQEAVDEEGGYVVECSRRAFSNEVDDWMTGANKNIKGKTRKERCKIRGQRCRVQKAL